MIFHLTFSRPSSRMLGSLAAWPHYVSSTRHFATPLNLSFTALSRFSAGTSKKRWRDIIRIPPANVVDTLLSKVIMVFRTLSCSPALAKHVQRLGDATSIRRIYDIDKGLHGPLMNRGPKISRQAGQWLYRLLR